MKFNKYSPNLLKLSFFLFFLEACEEPVESDWQGIADALESVSNSVSHVFSDDFSGSLTWDHSDAGYYQIIGGKLRISGPDDGFQHIAWRRLSDVTNYTYIKPEIEYIVDVDHVSGPEGSVYGIGLYSDNDVGYYFFISNYGSFEMVKYDYIEGSWTTLKDWSNDSEIDNSSGDGELKMIYTNTSFTVYFNDSYLAQYSKVGLKFKEVLLYTQDDAVIDFDNVRLKGTLTDN